MKRRLTTVDERLRARSRRNSYAGRAGRYSVARMETAGELSAASQPSEGSRTRQVGFIAFPTFAASVKPLAGFGS